MLAAAAVAHLYKAHLLVRVALAAAAMVALILLPVGMGSQIREAVVAAAVLLPEI
jgi:hypothetical protein